VAGISGVKETWMPADDESLAIIYALVVDAIAFGAGYPRF
jgi:hypothetical protein